MAQIEYIKHLYENEGKSLTLISKELHLNYRTVRKYATEYNWSPNEKLIKKRSHRVLGPYLELIDEWLTDDLKRPRKQRHTAIRIYNRLIEEHKFSGGKRTVSTYVNQKKKGLLQDKKGQLPLAHIPGESQLDFGEVVYIDAATETEEKGFYLTLSFPYSNAAYTQIFKGQNQECVIEGLQRMFLHIGGVPTAIVMDNMSSVVSKVLPHGEREIAEGFKRFALHYRFNMRFCNPAAGNEKGHVEGKIGYHRRNWFVPLPRIENLEMYNKTLWEKAETDMNRPHYLKGVNIEKLFKEDQEKLLYLPENNYDGFKYIECRIDKYGCIKIDTNKYSISPDMVKETVSVKVYFDKIKVYSDRRFLVEYERMYKKNQEIFDWKQYLKLLSNKPRALEHTKFYEQLPEKWRHYLLEIDRKERKSALLLLRDIVADDNIECGETAIELSQLYGKVDVESIRQCYYGLTLDNKIKEPCIISADVPLLNYKPKLNDYDVLIESGVN